MEVVGEPAAQVRPAEDGVDKLHQHVPQPDADDGADYRGADAVDSALNGKHAHQVPPLHADGAGHAHLALPLRGEHGEDEEDQQQAGADREKPERGEDRDEQRADLVGPVHNLLLQAHHVETLATHVVAPIVSLDDGSGQA